MIKHKRKKVFYTLLAIVLLLAAFRIYLPTLVTNYTNKTLQEIPDYTGSISGVNICLLKGEYRIKDLEIYKRGNEDSKPLMKIPATDLSIQWAAIKQGRIVGEVEMYDPELNVIMLDGESSKAGSQTGADVDWTEPLKELMPLDINRFTITNGKLSYLDPIQSPKVEIFANNLEIVATNLSNSTDNEDKLPSKIVATGSSIGGGKMYMTTRINILKKIPDLDYEFKFEGVDISALNSFSSAYAALDFEGGNLDLYSEMAIKDGKIDGYFKPVLNDIDLINFSEEVSNPFKLIWEGVAALFLEIFENQGNDQFATKVPLKGDLNTPETEVFSTLLNVIKNAFIEAFQKKVDDTVDYESVE